MKKHNLNVGTSYRSKQEMDRGDDIVYYGQDDDSDDHKFYNKDTGQRINVSDDNIESFAEKLGW